MVPSTPQWCPCSSGTGHLTSDLRRREEQILPGWACSSAGRSSLCWRQEFQGGGLRSVAVSCASWPRPTSAASHHTGKFGDGQAWQGATLLGCRSARAVALSLLEHWFRVIHPRAVWWRMHGTQVSLSERLACSLIVRVSCQVC